MDFHEAANIFPLDEDSLHDLADDIREHGLQMPIEVYEGKILDGRRRWKACKMASVEPDMIEVDPDDPVAYVLSLNLHRRHLTVSQAAMCAQRARAMYDAAAKERQKEHGNTAPGKDKDTCGQLATSDSGKARDKVGKAFGVSGKTVGRVQQIVRDGIPEVADAVDAGKISANRGVQIVVHPKDMQSQLLAVAITGKSGKKSIKAKPPEPETEPQPTGKSRGRGIELAHEAIACLKRIPKNDALRKRGFQVVSDWIKNCK